MSSAAAIALLDNDHPQSGLLRSNARPGRRDEMRLRFERREAGVDSEVAARDYRASFDRTEQPLLFARI
jgi:hypothetical protein